MHYVSRKSTRGTWADERWRRSVRRRHTWQAWVLRSRGVKSRVPGGDATAEPDMGLLLLREYPQPALGLYGGCGQSRVLKRRGTVYRNPIPYCVLSLGGSCGVCQGSRHHRPSLMSGAPAASAADTSADVTKYILTQNPQIDQNERILL